MIAKDLSKQQAHDADQKKRKKERNKKKKRKKYENLIFM